MGEPVLIEGFGDRFHLSLSGIGGFGGGFSNSHQQFGGVSARIGWDAVKGPIIIAPTVDVAYSRVHGDRRHSVDITKQDVFPDRYPVIDRYYVVDERAKAHRLSPRAGISFGYMDRSYGMGLGGEAFFLAGRERVFSYDLESYSKGTRREPSFWGPLSFKTGARMLVDFQNSRNRRKSDGPTIGFVFELAMSTTVNPVTHNTQPAFEGGGGIFTTF